MKLILFSLCCRRLASSAWPMSFQFHMCTCTEPCTSVYTHLFSSWVTASGLFWTHLETDTSPFLLLPISRFLYVRVSTLMLVLFIFMYMRTGHLRLNLKCKLKLFFFYQNTQQKCISLQQKSELKKITTEVLWFYFLSFHLSLHLKIMFQELSEKLSSLLKHLVLFP